MEKQFESTYYTHLLRSVVVLLVIGVGGLSVKALLVPSDFGEYGHYRTGAIYDELNQAVRNQTNNSCLECHPFIKKIHLSGVHQTVSCEVCHGPNADHAASGKKIAGMPVKRGDEIKHLCLRCHNKIIRARPEELIKMVNIPQHLEEKRVRIDNNCNQCHHVHAPLKWVIEAKKTFGLVQEEEGRFPWMN